jgi:hypothetical protein
MYPPPDQEVLEKLKNSPLLDVSFGLYVIHLTFDNGNRLSLAAPFRFSSEEAIADAAVIEFPIRESDMMRLLSHSVRDVRCDPDGSLELSFTNGDTLIVYANDPMYEAYTLLIEGHEYIV